MNGSIVEDLGTLQSWWDGTKRASGIYAVVGYSHTYIGQSKNVVGRIQQHAKTVFGQMSPSQELSGAQAILRKQASRPIKVILLEECAEEKLDEREDYWINLLVKLNIPLANRAPGGGVGEGESISMNEWIEKKNG